MQILPPDAPAIAPDEIVDLIRESRKREVRIVEVHDPIDPSLDNAANKETWSEALINATVHDYLPPEWILSRDTVVQLNGDEVPRDRWPCRYVSKGDEIIVSAAVRELSTAIIIASVVISIASPFIQRALVSEPDAPRGKKSPLYGQPSITTGSVADGNPIPIVYGRLRIGGTIIHESTRHLEGAGGRPTQGGYESAVGLFRSHTVVALSEGTINRIGPYVADFDTVHMPTNAPTGGEVLSGDWIKVDDNRLQDFVGEGFISGRRGRANQKPLPNMTTRIDENLVDLELTHLSWKNYQTNTGLDGMVFRIFFPNGYGRQSPSRGNRGQQQLSLDVRWRLVGEVAWREEITLTEYIHFEDSSAWSFVRWFNDVTAQDSLPSPRDNPVEVEMRRIFPTLAEEPVTFGTARWLSVGELYLEKAQTFPGTSTIALDAAVFQTEGSIQNITTLIEGKKTYNFDENDPDAPPVLGWSQIPADHAIDLCTSRVGARDLFGKRSIHWPTFMDWKAFSKEQIGDGRGGLMNRHESNIALDDQRPFKEQLGSITAAGRAKYLFLGSQVKIKIEREQPVAQRFHLFGMGSIIRDSFQIEYPDDELEASAFDVRFRDKDLDYEWNVASYERPENTGDDAVIIRRQFEARGTTDYTRAYNLAYHLAELGREQEIIKLRLHLESLAVEPGDVISLMHNMPDWGGISGRLRVDAPGSTSIKLDQPVTIPAGVGQVFKVAVWTTKTGADVLQVRNLVQPAGTYAAGTILAISPSWDAGDLPRADDNFSAGLGTSDDDKPDKGPYRLYTVVDARKRESFEAELSLMKYKPRAYLDPDPVAPPARKIPKVANPWTIPFPCRDIVAKTEYKPSKNFGVESSGVGVRVTWARARWPLPYDCIVWVRIDSQNHTIFRPVARTSSSSFLFEDVVEGWTYTVGITPASSDGRHFNRPEAEGEAPPATIVVRRGGDAPPRVT